MRSPQVLFASLALTTLAYGQSPPVQAPSTRVQARTLQPRRLVERAILRGVAQPLMDLMLSAESAGRIEAMPVEIGQRLAPKALIARVDLQLQRAQIKQAEAAERLASATLARLEALLKDAMTSPQQVDQARAQAQQAKATLEVAKIQRARSTVRTPIGGVVVEKRLDQGEYAMPGAPLIRLLHDDVIRLVAHAPERQVSRLRPKMPAQVRFTGLDEVFKAEIHLILPVANPKSHTFEVHFLIDNHDHHIYSGMSAEVDILMATHEGVVIPQDWIVEGEGARLAFVVEGGVARRRVVEVGASAEGQVLISKGLAMGEQIVTFGQRSLRDEQRVQVVER
ncbi:efflux RND transporter periplasmic adaptor subunit [Myxococcota bacterium]|nr:efflux RND transporter periplasmic adaptor subunit [Myxococcota bacterium]MBU1431905.1 efflux RND transporter periplasmic adaptor subunit [Myxococcota bacterium]MBU1897062.1 efflux RND transporter periplasmic adaptor subunit [Myxococcota bacterium]